MGDKAFSSYDLIQKGTTIVKEFWIFFVVLFCVFHGQEDCFIIVLLSYKTVLDGVCECCMEYILKSSNFVCDVHEFEGIAVV